MIAVRLSPEIEARLEKLAKATRRTKSHYIREALVRYLGEREETLLALARIETGESASSGEAAWSTLSGHARIDRRSLAMHRAIAEKLLLNPGILEKAKENIRRWRRQGVNEYCMEEWEVILAKGVDEVIRFIRSESEDATRLRHSTPFAGVLTPRERWKFYEKIRA
ncbi:MAG: ribbon-helix-helix protein, CopG family [Deltaproteobacteria bacterium]|nr:ribbon-helix-helix protein, CopG family [Deltaproteobacteria bacterium]